jgi:hypothetical protein
MEHTPRPLPKGRLKNNARIVVPLAVMLAVGLVGSLGDAVKQAPPPSLPASPVRLPSTPGIFPHPTAITAGVTAAAFRDAIVDDALTIGLVAGQSATFVSHPASGSYEGTSDSAINSFPQGGLTFGLLSSGNVTFAPLADTSGSTSEDNGFATSDRGPSDFDTVIVGINFADPPRLVTDNDQSWCLSVDFRFLSEEYPEWVGSGYNDGFIAELDDTTWFTTGAPLSPIVAPTNFGVTPVALTINGLGTDMSVAGAKDTTYDGGTPHYRAYTNIVPLAPGALAHQVYFSVFDQGDHIYDSTVFLDALRVFHIGAGEPCLAGAVQTVHA